MFFFVFYPKNMNFGTKSGKIITSTMKIWQIGHQYFMHQKNFKCCLFISGVCWFVCGFGSLQPILTWREPMFSGTLIRIALQRTLADQGHMRWHMEPSCATCVFGLSSTLHAHNTNHQSVFYSFTSPHTNLEELKSPIDCIFGNGTWWFHGTYGIFENHL